MKSESAKLNTSSNFIRVTPSDSIDTTGIRALYVVTDGTLALENNQGVSVDFGNVVHGERIDAQPSKVLSTGTTAVVNGYF